MQKTMIKQSPLDEDFRRHTSELLSSAKKNIIIIAEVGSFKFFIDTTVFIAAFNVRDKFHEPGLKLLKNPQKNKLKDESNLKSIMRAI